MFSWFGVKLLSFKNKLIFMGNFSQIVILSFCQKNSLKNDQNNFFFILKILILIFNFLNFETPSPKPHPLTLNSKSILVNPRVKIYFYSLIKLILVIFFIECYFCDKNLKMVILGNFLILVIL